MFRPTRSVTVSPLVIISLFLICTQVREVASLDIDVAVLAYTNPESLPSHMYLRPAVETGVESLRRSTYPSFNVSVSYITGSAPSCIEMGARLEETLAAWYYHKPTKPGTVRIIVSTGCSEVEAMNQLAANWNILLVVTVGRLTSVASLTDSTRRTFPTYLTTTYMSSVEDSCKELFLRLNWTLIYIIADTRGADILPLYSTWSQGVVQTLGRDPRFTIRATMRNNFFSPEPLDIRSELLKLQLFSRVLLLFGSPRQLRLLLVEAAALNMTSGDYAYVIIKGFENSYYNNFGWENGDQNDEIVKRAYGAVLMISLGEFDNVTRTAVGRLMPEWRERFLRSNNISTGTRDLVSLYLICTHQAFQLMGQALLQRSNGSQEADLQNGRLLASTLVNRTHHLDSGEVIIDELGRRIPHFAFRYFNDEENNFKTFMRSNRRNRLVVWNRTRLPIWFGSDILPADRPACGFRNENPDCHPRGSTAVVIGSVCSVLVVLLLSIGGMGWHIFRVDTLGTQMESLTSGRKVRRTLARRDMSTWHSRHSRKKSMSSTGFGE